MEFLKINNFKCFHEINIPLNFLTIMAGANGNGKSTAVQALLFIRKTIEENFKIFESYYSIEERKLNFNVGLNSGYMLSLGNSSYVLNRQSRANEISIGIVEKNTSHYSELIINYFANNKEAQLYLEAISITQYLAVKIPILKKEFYYLNAERIGPRVSQGIQTSDFLHAGYQGEYVAQLIASANYTIVIEEDRRFPSIKSPWLEPQTNAWLNYILPGAIVSAQQSLDTLTAQLQIENYFTKGEPTISTNVGFGISYVLPIIVTGLIALKGSYMIVENPEAHLHPSAQSKIGRFLAMIANSGVHVIIETHSDHIINGIQIAVAEKEINNESITIIDNNLVTVNFFDQLEEAPQPVVENISINKKGELSKWPKGFFDQTQIDFAELFKIRKG